MRAQDWAVGLLGHSPSLAGMTSHEAVSPTLHSSPRLPVMRRMPSDNLLEPMTSREFADSPTSKCVGSPSSTRRSPHVINPLLSVGSSPMKEDLMLPPCPLSPSPEKPRSVSQWFRLQLPAVVIAMILNLLDAIPYGLAILPATFQHTAGLGVALCFLSTATAQLAIAVSSSFRSGLGSMMVENLPFWHQIAESVRTNGDWDDPSQALPTVLVFFALSSIFVGLLFLLVAALRLGSVVQFFPAPVLMGCMGGIGVFLIQTGLEASSGLVIKDSSWADWFEADSAQLWGSSMALVAVHRGCRATKLAESSLFDPLFFLAVPVVFYLVVAITGTPISTLQDSRWLYEPPEQSSPNPFQVWKSFSPLSSIQWSLFPKQIPTILGLGFFSLLHVPLNIPLMAALTDIDGEFRCHGYANLLAGATGTLQNYLVYCNSALYRGSGGDGKLSSLVICIGTVLMMGFGSTVIGYIPRLLAGCMMAQLGLAFVEDAVLASRRALSWSELLTVLAIMISMVAIGFLEGVAIGLGLACLVFVVQSARGKVVRRYLNGASLSSRVQWPTRQELILKHTRKGVRVLQLQGHLFFGSLNQLQNAMQSMNAGNVAISSQASFLACPDSFEDVPVTHVILDLELVISADFSGCKAIADINDGCIENRCRLVLCNGTPYLWNQLLRTNKSLQEIPMLPSLAEALFWCENSLVSGPTELFVAPTASLVSCLGELIPDSVTAARFAALWTECSVEEGTVMWSIDGEPIAVFVAEGELEEIDCSNRAVRVMSGNITGLGSLALGESVQSNLVVSKRSKLWTLGKEGWQDLQANDPRLGAIATTLALRYGRLVKADCVCAG